MARSASESIALPFFLLNIACHNLIKIEIPKIMKIVGLTSIVASVSSIFSNDVINKENDEKVAVKKLLTSYSIWICKGSIKAEIEKITNAINDTIIAHEFD